MSERLGFFASCPPGIESLLADELRRLGLTGVRPQRSGVLFAGSVADALKAVFWSRLASRVLLTLEQVPAANADALYAAVREMPWEDHMRAGGTLAVSVVGVNDALRNTQFTAVRTKDAIVDRFRERFGRRPSVDVKAPELRVNVAVRADRATVSIDLAGEPLHRRGYREPGVQVQAPLKENLAAAVLELAYWRSLAASGGALVDPLCGSATLAIEGALAAGDIAPGLLRRSHAVTRWLGFDAGAWEAISDDAALRRREGLESLPAIVASDVDERAVAIARACVSRAGLDGRISVERREVARLAPPAGFSAGLVATNPPWGERLSERSELPVLYAQLAERLDAFEGWSLAVISPDPDLAAHLRMKPEAVKVLGTGKGAITVSRFEVGKAATRLPAAKRGSTQPTAGSGSTQPTAGSGRPATGTGGQRRSTAHAEQFANRLHKMSRHFGKWARRADVSCFRVYDADLPDFALAVDLYQGAGPHEGRRWAHVAEYAAPAHIDEDKAAARLEAAVGMVPEVLGVSPDDVFVKRRQRQRASSQYERFSRRGVKGIVAEQGLLFEVNFSDYLDTGLFLDHRDTRAWLGEIAAGTRFLNLFAYTGTATVHAARGKAASTTTVDLSATYLDWAERNMVLNGFEGQQHRRERADVMEWLASAAHSGDRYDLVFCDPPTFSNSKRMEGTWDVQRDHVALLGAIEPVLAEQGQLVFSCNRRSFDLDREGLAAAHLVAEDVTVRTIPKDFERRPGVHRCWTIRRG